MPKTETTAEAEMCARISIPKPLVEGRDYEITQDGLHILSQKLADTMLADVVMTISYRQEILNFYEGNNAKA
jgi:hypothetical protein